MPDTSLFRPAPAPDGLPSEEVPSAQVPMEEEVVTDLERLVSQWLTLPEAAERLGVDVGRVRRLLEDRLLVAVRRGQRRVLSVPVELVPGDQPLPDLRGTLAVLADARFTDPQALRWLLTPDDSLPGRPVDALRENRKTEVRRRAQVLGF